MLEQYVKQCKAHGIHDAARIMLALEHDVDRQLAADKSDWSKLPEGAADFVRECVIQTMLENHIIHVKHVHSKISGNISLGVYMIADLYNELTATRKALAEANATLIINNISPIGESDNANNHAE